MHVPYTVTLSPGIIPSLAVLHTEKLAFQCATLLGPAEGDKAMNLAALYVTGFAKTRHIARMCKLHNVRF